MRLIAVRFGNVLALERLGRPEVQGADRRRRTGHRHAQRHGALLHDHPRGLAISCSRRPATRSGPSAPMSRSMCSTWASRCASWNWPSG
jgi:hypothetical protein